MRPGGWLEKERENVVVVDAIIFKRSHLIESLVYEKDYCCGVGIARGDFHKAVVL